MKKLPHSRSPRRRTSGSRGSRREGCSQDTGGSSKFEELTVFSTSDLFRIWIIQESMRMIFDDDCPIELVIFLALEVYWDGKSLIQLDVLWQFYHSDYGAQGGAP